METTSPRAVFPALFLGVCEATVCGLAILAVRSLATHATGIRSVDAAILVPWQALAMLMAAALVVALIVRSVKARTAWELLLGITLFLGVWVYLWHLLPIEFALLAASLVTLVQAWVRRVWVHDAFILLGTAGVALNFALVFPPHILAVLLVGLVVYDTFGGRPGGVIARFAASLVHRGVIPGLIVPGSIAGLSDNIPVAIHKPDAIFLGAGDLILPLLFVAQAAIAGLLPAVMVSLGIIAAALWLGSRGPTPAFPALAPLALGAAIPYFVLMFTHVV